MKTYNKYTTYAKIHVSGTLVENVTGDKYGGSSESGTYNVSEGDIVTISVNCDSQEGIEAFSSATVHYDVETSNVIAITGDAHDVAYEYNSADAITNVTYPNQISDPHTKTIMAYGPEYADDHGLPELPVDFSEFDESYTIGSNQTITYQLEAGYDPYYYTSIEVNGIEVDYCEDGETSNGSISVNDGDVVTIIVGCSDFPGVDDPDESYSSASLSYVTIDDYNISSSYDLRGLLRSVNDIVGTSGSAGFEYDANGNCTDLHYENGIDVTKTYNSRNWITYEDLVSIGPTYAFYDNGNLETRTLSPTDIETYSYDGLNRLESAYYTNSQYTDEVFDYDLNGNRESYNSTSYYYTSGTNQLKGIGSTSTQFEYDANGNLKYDNRDGLKAMYLYDYKNRLIGVRPERWDQWWSSTTTVPQPGYVCVDNGEFSIYSANNVSSTYVEREIPNVSLHDDVPYPNTELSFDFDKVASIDCNRFYFYFMNSETGAYLRVHYYRRSHTINVGQYSAANGYEDIYTNTAFYEDDGNCKLVIATGDIISFYFDGVLKGTTLLDEEIDDINNVRILINEGHFHYDDIIVDQIFNAGTPSEYTTTIVDLDFSDGPYAQFADYYYNTNDERILTVKSQEAESYYPFKTSIYNGNGQTLCEYKINKSASYSFLNDYVYGNGQKLAKFDGSDIEYYHNNYLGSIQAITNESGTVTWSRDYYPFGEEKGTGTGTDDANAYKFTGKEWDDESDFFYSWHRYYDSSIGRFVQVDPIWGKYLSMSPYHYALNNPLRYVDPTGMWTASFRSSTNDVYATREKNDTNKDLYSQLGISKGEFYKKHLIGSLIGRVRITDYVLSNKGFDVKYRGSNCHGFAAFATNPNATNEESSSNFNSSEMSATKTPTTGDVAVFNMQGQYQYVGEQPVNANNVQGHSAIFIAKNQAGQAQFLNRINTGHAVTVNTQSQIVNFFANPQNAYHGSDAYAILPKLNPDPIYYSK